MTTTHRTEGGTPFRVEYNNDTGPGDEGFWEWWIVTDDSVSYRVDYKEQAEALRDLLNCHAATLAQNEALRRALKPFAAIAPHVASFGKVSPEQVFLWKPSNNIKELPGITAAHIQAAAVAFNSTPPTKA